MGNDVDIDINLYKLDLLNPSKDDEMEEDEPPSR